MRQLRKFLTIITLLVTVASFLTVCAQAETLTKDGITAELYTEKESYAPGETITAVLTVKNTNSFAVRDLSLELFIPEGLTLQNSAETRKLLSRLEAGATETVSVSLICENSEAQNDWFARFKPYLPTIAIITVGVIAVIALACWIVHKIRYSFIGILCCLLCAASLFSALPLDAYAQENAPEGNGIQLSVDVTVDEQTYTLRAEVFCVMENADQTEIPAQMDSFRILTGQFTDQKVHNEQDAISAVRDAAEELGLENATEELTLVHTSRVDDLIFYRLQQNYRGIPVYGSTVVVVADESGETKGLTGNAVDISGEFSFTPTVTQEQAESSIRAYFGEMIEVSVPALSDTDLRVYTVMADEDQVLAYEITVLANDCPYSVILDAHSSEVYNAYSRVYYENEVSKNDKRYYRDTERDIIVLNAKGKPWEDWSIHGQKFDEAAETNEEAADLIKKTQLTYDFFLNELECKSYSGKDSSLVVILDCSFTETTPNNAMADTDHVTVEQGMICFGYDNLRRLETVAHEYTHLVEHMISSMNYNGFSGAIMEGYSDIFGELVEDYADGKMDGSCDWIHGGRNMINPLDGENDMKQPKSYPAKMYDPHWASVNSTKDFGGVHTNCTVISHAGYLMASKDSLEGSPLTTTELAKLWYGTLHSLHSDCSFHALRAAMEMTANAQNLSSDKIRRIKAAFDAVGITTYECSGTFSIDVYDFLDNPYDNYSVVIRSKTYRDQKSPSQGSVITVDNLKNGNYWITITDKAYRLNLATILVKVNDQNQNINQTISVFLPGGHSKTEHMLADYVTDGTPPNDLGNRDAIALAAQIDVKLRGDLIYMRSGITSDQRVWTKYQFIDEETYIIYTKGADQPDGDLYVMFAKAGSTVLGGCHDEVYRRVSITDSIIGRWLDTSDAALTHIASNAKNSHAFYSHEKSESSPSGFLYWDASEKQVLTSNEWKNQIHFTERFELNDDRSLPRSAADAVKEGFTKLPVSDVKYHQIYEDKYKNWYEILESEFQKDACLKYCHKDGREAIYLITKDSQNRVSIESDYNATQLITLAGYPKAGPTFNYSPNDFSEDFITGLLSKATANSVAHYYFDMLPYYWWGNAPSGYGHVHTFGDWSVTRQPTETAKGEQVRTCSACGARETLEIPMLNHTHAYVTTTQAATCTEQGWTKKACACGDVITEAIPTVPHDYVNGKCSMCGEKHPDHVLIPEDALAYNGHYYKYISEKMLWHDAKAYCESLGGYLAVITTAEENAFITSMIPSNIVIGLTDEEHEGIWKWVTNEAYAYHNFRTGEPNNLSEEDYVCVDLNGTWNDGHADREYWNFVCEWGDPISDVCGTPTIVTANGVEVAQGNGLTLTWTAPSVPGSGHTYFIAIMEGGRESETYTEITSDWITATSYVIDPSFLSNIGTYVITLYAKAEGYKQADTSINVSVRGKTSSDGLTFQLNGDNKSYSVTGIGTCTDTDIIIPTTYEGLPVTAIAYSAFKNCENITSLTIPDSVTEIGQFAFFGCKRMEWVTFGSGLQTIRGGAFADCISLKEIVLPANVKKLEDSVHASGIGYRGVFENCAGLTKVTVGDESMDIELTTIGSSAFKNCSSLTSVYIGNAVSAIHSEAFAHTGITSLSLGNQLLKIDLRAFCECEQLESVAIPDSVTEIGQFAFFGCKRMEWVTFGSGLQTIRGGAFADCISLKEIVLPANVKKLEDSVHASGIGYRGVFENCAGLTKVTVGDESTDIELTTIGSSAFRNCLSLKTLCIGASVEKIGGSAFSDCTALLSIQYMGTEDEWQSVVKDTDWDKNTGAYTVQYSHN